MVYELAIHPGGDRVTVFPFELPLLRRTARVFLHQLNPKAPHPAGQEDFLRDRRVDAYAPILKRYIGA